MAIGDIKGQEAIVKKLTAGAVVTKGQVVHHEPADDKWDPVVDGDSGKFAVAIEAAAADGDEFDAVIWGRVEVTATAATIAELENVIAGSTGKVVKATVMTVLDAPASYGESTMQTELDKILDPRLTVGTTMEAFDSAGSGTIFVGMVG